MANQRARSINEGRDVLFEDIGDGSRALAVAQKGQLAGIANPISALLSVSDLVPNGTNQSLTVTNGAVVTIGALPAGTIAFRIAVKTASVNLRTDGTDPTTSVGEQLDDGFKEVWPAAWQASAEFIAVSGNANVFIIPLKRA